MGYDLQTSLIVSDQNGEPLAPVAQRLVSADGSYATYVDGNTPTSPAKHPLDEVSDCIAYLDGQGFAKPLHHGKAYRQWVAETDVTVTRPAKPSQKKSKKPCS